jgi:hypothetical protein
MSRGSTRPYGLLLTLLALAGALSGASRLSGQTLPPDPPTGLRVVVREGDHVTLAWDAASSGPSAEGYVIEGGLQPGEVLGAIPTGGAQTTFDFDVPPGRFWVRVHAIAGSVRSRASNVILLAAGQACRHACGYSSPARSTAPSRSRPPSRWWCPACRPVPTRSPSPPRTATA